MKDFSLKQLRVLVAVVEYGSFTEAANRLFISQSTVSSHIQSLEECFNVMLFERGAKKHIELTADGRRVYRYAKEILGRCNAFEADMSDDADLEVNLGASTISSRCILPAYIAGYLEEHPGRCFYLKNGDSEQIQQMLLDNSIQIGFVGTSDHRRELIYELIAEDPLIVVTPNTERFAQLKKKGVYGRELLTEPLVLREQGSGTQRLVDNYLSSIEMDAGKMHAAARVSSPETAKELVALGVGVAVTSSLIVKDDIEAGNLLGFALSEQPLIRNIYMVRRKRGLLTEPAGEFFNYVHDRCH